MHSIGKYFFNASLRLTRGVHGRTSSWTVAPVYCKRWSFPKLPGTEPSTSPAVSSPPLAFAPSTRCTSPVLWSLGQRNSGPLTSARQSWLRRLVWTRAPNAPRAVACARSLRRDDPAHRVAPRQHNAAMIDFRRRACLPQGFRNLPLQQRSSACRAPVAHCFLAHHSVTLAAHPVHGKK